VCVRHNCLKSSSTLTTGSNWGGCSMKCINSFLSASVHRNSKIAEMGKMHVFRFHVVWFNHWGERRDIEGVEKRETSCLFCALFWFCYFTFCIINVGAYNENDFNYNYIYNNNDNDNYNGNESVHKETSTRRIRIRRRKEQNKSHNKQQLLMRRWKESQQRDRETERQREGPDNGNENGNKWQMAETESLPELFIMFKRHAYICISHGYKCHYRDADKMVLR